MIFRVLDLSSDETKIQKAYSYNSNRLHYYHLIVIDFSTIIRTGLFCLFSVFVTRKYFWYHQDDAQFLNYFDLKIKTNKKILNI